MKAKARVPDPEASNPNDWLGTTLVAAEFIAVRLDETEHRAQQPGIREMSGNMFAEALGRLRHSLTPRQRSSQDRYRPRPKVSL